MSPRSSRGSSSHEAAPYLSAPRLSTSHTAASPTARFRKPARPLAARYSDPAPRSLRALEESDFAPRIGERILFTGASGLLGRESVLELLRVGYDVRVLQRGDSGIAALLPDSIRSRFEQVRGDITNEKVVDEAMTGVDGVVIGRGCQGRPWLFGDLQNAFEGSPERVRPTLSEVADMIYRHAELLVETFSDETRGLREIRKHVAWYFKGYPVGGELRAKMAQVPDLATFRELLAQLDHTIGYPGAAVEGSRGRAGSPKQPHLPDGWLDSRILGDAERLGLVEAELDISGG